MLARRSLGKGGSIARRPSPGRHRPFVRHSFSEGGSLPRSGLTPFLLVLFVLLVPFVPFQSIPFPPPNRNRNRNLPCLYALPLSPIRPVPVPPGALKRFALFPFFSTLFPNARHRPIMPNPLRQSRLHLKRTGFY